jgi:hypothetical protein
MVAGQALPTQSIDSAWLSPHDVQDIDKTDLIIGSNVMNL